MIHFHYYHVTQNANLELQAQNSLNKILREYSNQFHCKLEFFRQFDEKNQVNEVVKLTLSINGALYSLRGQDKLFKNSLQIVLDRLSNELKVKIKNKSSYQVS